MGREGKDDEKCMALMVEIMQENGFEALSREPENSAPIARPLPGYCEARKGERGWRKGHQQNDYFPDE